MDKPIMFAYNKEITVYVCIIKLHTVSQEPSLKNRMSHKILDDYQKAQLKVLTFLNFNCTLLSHSVSLTLSRNSFIILKRWSAKILIDWKHIHSQT